jgi:hypothetical protein
MPASLLVHRHSLHLRAPAGARTPPVTALADELATALAAELRVRDPGGTGVWLIRRLDVRACVADRAGAREVAGVLCQALLGELARTVEDGACPDVRWFPDRAAFLTAWLVDVAAGRARDRWEYRRLGSATGSAAVRERAGAEPAALLRALRQLPGAGLDALVGLLEPGDAAAVVHALSGAVVAAPGGASVTALAGTVRGLLDAGRLPDDPRRATLAVLLAAPGMPTAAAAACARDLVHLTMALRSCGWDRRARLAGALAGGDWAGATRLGAAGELVTALAGWSDQDRAAAVEILTSAPTTGEVPDPAEPERVHTSFGAVFLLLPLLAALPFGQVSEGWPPLRDVAPDRLLALLAVLGVLGADRAPLALTDPWLRLGLGLPDLDASSLGDWLGELGGWLDGVGTGRAAAAEAALEAVLARRPELAETVAIDLADESLLLGPLLAPHWARAMRVASSALLRELAVRLTGVATASASYLRRNVLDLDAHVTAEPDRVVVELGHPPLNLLLTLAGLNRGSFTLPATEDRIWLLTSAR